MVSRAPTFCVTCAFFDIHAALAGGGVAFCSRYETMRHWHHPATVLYLRRTDANRLLPLIEQLQKDYPELEKKE